MKVIKLYYCLAILFLATSSACSNRVIKPGTDSPPPGIEQVSEQEDAKILILQFTVFKTKSGNDSITLVSADVVPGFLKTDMTEALPNIPAGKLRCTLLDIHDNPLKSTVIDNPLQRSLELPPISKEDEGHNHVNVNVEKTAFMIRARFTRTIRSVVVEKSDKNSNPEYRIKFDIPVI